MVSTLAVSSFYRLFLLFIRIRFFFLLFLLLIVSGMDATIPVVYLHRSKFCVAFSPFSHFFLPFLFFFHSFILFDPIRLFPSRDRYRSSDVDTRADEFLIERVQINCFLFFIGQTKRTKFRFLLNCVKFFSKKKKKTWLVKETNRSIEIVSIIRSLKIEIYKAVKIYDYVIT